MKQLKKFLIVAVVCFAVVSAECYNKCSGHGTCDTSNRCICHRQYGLGLNEADFNAEMYTGADCSERLCPTGVGFTPIVDEEEYFEVVKVNRRRELFENRELDGTDDDASGTDSGDEEPTTTPSIDEIIKDLQTLNKTEIEKPVEVFKPVTSTTPSLGGSMECNGKYVTIATQAGNQIVSDVNITELNGCKVTYVRKDLSLYGVLDFSKRQTATWNNNEEMLLYGFQYDTQYDVNVACVHDEVTGKIKEESNKVTLLNQKDGKVTFTYNKAKKETYPSFCYLLTVGVDSNSKVQNVELLSSELAEMVGKSSDGLVFGSSIENGAVVVMKGSDVNPTKSQPQPRERLLADAATKTVFEYFLNLDKSYNPATNGTTDEDDTTTTGSASDKPRERMLQQATGSAVAGSFYSAYKKYLQVGNKVFIRVLTDKKKFLTPQTLHIVKETQTCADYCAPKGSNTCSIDDSLKKSPGCYVIFLNKEIRGSGTDDKLDKDDTIYFTLTAVGIHPTYECSGVGKCNRQTGQCECLPGYTGDACQILSCPNDCSNHGRCVKSSQTIVEGAATFVESVPEMFGYGKTTKQKLYGCICDKGYRGPDCSLIECPSTKDPSGGSNDPTKTDDQYRDCSGRGICDYTTGNCGCFDGFVGTACENILSSM